VEPDPGGAAEDDLDGYVFRPVLAGFWRQRETWDGTYSFADLVDIHRLMDAQHRARMEEAK
jgi:hypothetical protein